MTLRLLSIIKIHLIKKKIYCYLTRKKEYIPLLDLLWYENLIWGYTMFHKYIKIYLKYKNNIALIKFNKIWIKSVTLKELRIHAQRYPQTLFILKTSQGFKSHKYCFSNNLSGVLILKIN